MIEKKGDLDDLMLICKLVKPDGSTCNKSTKLNQVENGVIKIKYANTRAHLLTHGPSVMLTSAEAAEARKVLAEKEEKERGAKRVRSASPAEALVGAGAGAGVEAAGALRVLDPKSIVALIVQTCSVVGLPFNSVNNIGFRLLMSKVGLVVPSYSMPWSGAGSGMG